MMQKGEGAGFGLSVIGHGGLLALLSLNLMSVREMPKLSQSMDVMLVDKAGLVSGAPQVAQEAPQASEAPEVADTPEDAPPPDPAPTSRPTPAPAKPAVSQKAAEKPAPPAPPAPKAKPKATSLSNDFLKGIPVEKSTGKAAAPRAAISPLAMNGLAALLLQQVRPCYNPPAGGTDTASIATVLDLKMKRDGSVASVQIGEQTGINAQNRPYASQMADAARRAVLRCSPFKLPVELYEGGWDDFAFRFRPS